MQTHSPVEDRPVRLLFVEDDPEVAHTISSLLASDGHDVRLQHVGDLSRALDAAAEASWDVVLADLGLPDSEGLDTVRTIRSAAPHLPVVVLTGGDPAIAGPDAIKAGAQDYILKAQATPELLRKSILYAIERGRTERMLRRSQEELAAEVAARTSELQDTVERLEKQVEARTEAEATLRAAQARLELTQYELDTSSIGVFRASADGRFHYVNNALCRMAGLPREELLESRIEDVSLHRADVDREEHWRELEAEGHLKYSVHREDQGTVLLAVIVDRVDYGGGQYEVGFVEDVTERERAVQALQRNEAQLRAILESSTDAMAGIDETGSIVLFNRAAETLFGWGVDEITGRAVELLMPESCRQQHRADRESYFRTGEPNAAIGTTKVLPAITRDGRYLAVELSLSRVPGDPPIVLATMRDHTERQRLEHDLHTQNLLLEEIINAIPAPVFYKDLDGKYVDCNEQFADLVGRPRADVAGLGVDDVAPRELAELYARMDEELLRSGRAQIYEAAARYPDGTERNVMFHKAVYHDFAGRPAGIVGVMLDVTERKRAEEDRQLLAGAVEHAQDGIAIADRGGLTRYVNPAFARLIGVPVDQVRGMDPAATLARGEDRLASCMWRALRSKGTWSGVIAALPGEDGRPEMEATASAVLDSSGGPTAFIFVLRDLTERARLDQQLRQSQKLESIGQLAAGIAHEINTPIQYVGDNVRFFQDAWADLSPVLRSARDLGDSRDAAKGVAALAEQISAADPEYLLEEVPLAIDQSLEGISRISAIVRAMKEFSHPGGEAKSLADLNKAIEITVTVSRNEWKYVADLELNLDPALPPVPCLLGDINQVLLNLVTNSAHAIKEARGEESEPRGTITISSSCDDMFAYIKVSDTGCGIPEEIRHRVFDPFFTTKDVGKGTGQGLSLAHAVVHERHQGRLELESEVGVGTTFTIALPLHAEPEAGGP